MAPIPSFTHVCLPVSNISCVLGQMWVVSKSLCLHFIFVRCPFPSCQELFTTPGGRFYNCIHNLLKREPEIISTHDMSFPADYKFLKGNDTDLFILKSCHLLSHVPEKAAIYLLWFCMLAGGSRSPLPRLTQAAPIRLEWLAQPAVSGLTLRSGSKCHRSAGFPLSPSTRPPVLRLARLAPLHSASVRATQQGLRRPSAELTHHPFHLALLVKASQEVARVHGGGRGIDATSW